MSITPPHVETNRDSTQLSFEDALAQLQEVVARLESGELTLEETIQTFQRGSVLAVRCQGMIDNAELRITELASIDPERDARPEQAAIQLPD
ncbi:exodeoxyribonuclease VII small subunit [soil metagenome]